MTIIIGIDPGVRITGYGLIKQDRDKLLYLDSGCIKTTSIAPISDRLLQIFTSVCQLVEDYGPAELAIEQVFLHKNVQSALKLGHARGAAMLAAASHRLKVYEYAPREVKEAVVGYGNAQKNQVSHMVIHLLMLNKAPQVDAADALAVAICHSHRRQSFDLQRRKKNDRLLRRKRP